MRSATPKPFLLLLGRPLIAYTLRRFMEARTVGRVILVVAENEMARCAAAIRADEGLKPLNYLLQPGGPRRQDSVRQGLTRLDSDCEVVVIHDGARPLVPPALVDRCVEAADKEGAAVVGLPARDTIKMVSEGKIVDQTLPRDSLWQIQTPQAFRTDVILAAYELAKRQNIEATDDATLVEILGKNVVVLEGDPLNIKVTVPADLLFAEMLIQKSLP